MVKGSEDMPEAKIRIGLIVLLLIIIIGGIIYYFNFYPRENTMEGTLVKNESYFEYEDSTEHSSGL